MRGPWAITALFILCTIPSRASYAQTQPLSDHLTRTEQMIRSRIKKTGDFLPDDPSCRVSLLPRVRKENNHLVCSTCKLAEQTRTSRELLQEQWQEIARHFRAEQYDIGEPSRDVGNLLNLIASTDIGFELLKEFMPRFQRGEFKIRQITEAETTDGGTPNLGEYLIDKRELAIDFEMPMGLSSSVLFHEITHSVTMDRYQERLERMRKDRLRGFLRSWTKKLRSFGLLESDAELMNLADTEKYAQILYLLYTHLPFREFSEADKGFKDLDIENDKDRMITVFLRERAAFDAQFALASELAERYPCFTHTAYLYTAAGTDLAKRVTDDEIISRYRLDPEVIHGYLNSISQGQKDTAPARKPSLR